MLPLARRIVCRDLESYHTAQMYTDQVDLYHDFALDILDIYRAQSPVSDSKIAIINCNPYIRSEDTIQLFLSFARQYPDHQLYFIPGDMNEDLSYYYQLQTMIPHLQLYDWTKYSIPEICKFFAQVSFGIGARLHILMLLHYFQKPFQALTYQDKIIKILGQSPWMQVLVKIPQTGTDKSRIQK